MTFLAERQLRVAVDAFERRAEQVAGRFTLGTGSKGRLKRALNDGRERHEAVLNAGQPLVCLVHDATMGSSMKESTA